MWAYNDFSAGTNMQNKTTFTFIPYLACLTVSRWSSWVLSWHTRWMKTTDFPVSIIFLAISAVRKEGIIDLRNEYLKCHKFSSFTCGSAATKNYKAKFEHCFFSCLWAVWGVWLMADQKSTLTWWEKAHINSRESINWALRDHPGHWLTFFCISNL